MNYIFLDIDGVLNSQQYIMKVYNNKNIPHIEYNFDQKAFKILGKICKKNNAKIVLSSSWRSGFDEKMNSKFKDIYSIKLLEYLRKYNISLIGKTTLEYMDRGAQIRKYIREHCRQNDNYIVIDDEIKDITPYINKKYIIKTKFKTGLLYRHIRKCRKAFKIQSKNKKFHC